MRSNSCPGRRHRNSGFEHCIRVILNAGILAAVMLAWGCSQTPSGESRVLVIGAETGLHGFDVISNGGRMIQSTALAANLILEPLFRMDRNGNLIPVLGLTAGQSVDGKTWTITLRQGIRFHDGTEFDADAVVSHWQRMLDPERPFRGRHFLEPVQRVSRSGDATVTFHLKHAWPAFLATLSHPLSSLALIPSPAAVEAGIQNDQPVGTGPFRFSMWEPGHHFVVVKHSEGTSREATNADVVVIKALPDHNSRYASLLSGQSDLIVMDQGTLISKAGKDPDLKILACDQAGAEIVLLNTGIPPLDDIRVRRALVLGNDQRRHVSLAYQGTTFNTEHLVGSGLFCSGISPPEFDPDRARGLVSDLERPVELELMHTNTSRGRKTGEIMEQLCKQIGVALNLQGADTAQHVMRVTTGDYQMATWRFIPSLDPGPGLYAGFHSASPHNYGRCNNPELDRLLEAQRSELDPDNRRRLLCRAVSLINSEALVLLRGGRRFHVLARNSVQGLEQLSEGLPELAGVRVSHTAELTRQRQALLAALKTSGRPHDPGLLDARILGRWAGKDTRKGKLTFTFDRSGLVIAQRFGGRDESPRKGTYSVQGSEIKGEIREVDFWARLEGGMLKGRWELDNGFGADFSLKKSKKGESK